MWNGTGGCPSVISEMVTDVARDRESSAPPADVDVEELPYPGSFTKRWVLPLRRSSSVMVMVEFSSWW